MLSVGLRLLYTESKDDRMTAELVKLQAAPDLVDQVYRALLDAISDGSLAPGMRVTQEDLAARAGVSVQMVRRLEAGTANPTLGTLHAVTSALDIAWSDLLVEVER